MYKKAFTMAEVLITIGIIGIVTAMTMPGVIQGYKKKQTEVHLQKVYTILSQAFMQSQLKNGEYASWGQGFDMGAEEYFKIYWEPYLKKAVYCKTYDQCGYKSNKPWFLNNGTAYDYSVEINDYRAPFILSDGTFISVSTGGGIDSTFSENLINVDLNAGGMPNKLGIDLFVFVRTENGLIKPYGYDKTDDYINDECRQTGRTCAELIVRSGWKINKNYPWR